jgi:hypothetical protein
MQKLLILIIAIFLFASCQEEGPLTKNPELKSLTPSAILKYHGVFEPTPGIAVSGVAKIYLENGQYKVVLEDFNVSNGPDLKVYLSKAASPSGFINLGSLTSQTIYAVPPSVDVASYSHVLIHCQQYNHLFAIATLMPN